MGAAPSPEISTLKVFYATDTGVHSLTVAYRPEVVDGELSQGELDQVLRQHPLPNGARIVGVEIEGRSYTFLRDIGAETSRAVSSLPAARFAR